MTDDDRAPKTSLLKAGVGQTLQKHGENQRQFPVSLSLVVDELP